MEKNKERIKDLMQADKYGDAYILCGKALIETPDDADIVQIAQFIHQRIQDAHIEIIPSTAEEFTMLGIAYFYSKNLDASIYYYTKAIELDPSFDYAYKSRHFSYTASGKINESLRDIAKAIELNPTCGIYYFDCANLFHHLPGKKEQTLRYYLKSVQLEPDNFMFWYNFGIELEEQKYFKDAIIKFEMVLELSPKFVDAQIRIDRIYSLLNN
jgi:tetratricopeptide (TPR) repeat protein